jgi:hypothetical protein
VDIAYQILVRNKKGSERFGDVGADGMIIYREILGYEDVGWIYLAQDTIQQRALVNTVMNLWFP